MIDSHINKYCNRGVLTLVGGGLVSGQKPDRVDACLIKNRHCIAADMSQKGSVVRGNPLGLR